VADRYHARVPAQNPWLERRILCYAHQGGAWEWPSSTLFAIHRAIEAGATAVELDVHATLDGELVVCHDASVDRTTDGHGMIARMTLAELKRLDNAFWFIPGADVTPGRPASEYPYRGRAPEDCAFGIATLDEVLQEFPGVVLNLDIKQTAPAVPGYEERLAKLLAEHERTNDVIVASFLDRATEAFRHFAPGIPTSAGTLGTAMFWRATHDGSALPDLPVVALQVPEWHGELLVVDEQFVTAAHALGIAVHVWTINDRATMARLVDLGVDGIITDLPTTLASVLDERSVAWSRGEEEVSPEA
jgi:glycerophosphoryl diester phosphodiesterase